MPLGRQLVHMLLVGLAVPAAAQVPEQEPGDAVSRLNTKPFSLTCPERKPGDDIVVCGRRRQYSPYRLPPPREQRFDPRAGVASVSRERNKLMEGELGGLGSCTNIGPGGMTGCHEKGVQRSRQQRGK
jgi:hypothetical protein